MKRAVITVGLGFGDEGKGATVDFLTRELGADLVIRYCGGSQAGHNVELPDGRRHTFSQFGAGTLAPNRPRTYLGSATVIDPPAMLREAKRAGGYGGISIGVCPHHLYLTQDDVPRLGAYGLMKPELKTSADVEALWDAVIDGTVDVIESDHAPHTRAEKESDNPPYGVPGLETTLPLLCTAVNEGRITPDRLIELVSTNPARIFRLVPPPDTSTVIDLDSSYVIEDKHLLTAPGWSPFAGMRVSGKVIEVKIRGRIVYDGEQVIAAPGSGINVIDRLAQ